MAFGILSEVLQTKTFYLNDSEDKSVNQSRFLLWQKKRKKS